MAHLRKLFSDAGIHGPPALAIRRLVLNTTDLQLTCLHVGRATIYPDVSDTEPSGLNVLAFRSEPLSHA